MRKHLFIKIKIFRPWIWGEWGKHNTLLNNTKNKIKNLDMFKKKMVEIGHWKNMKIQITPELLRFGQWKFKNSR